MKILVIDDEPVIHDLISIASQKCACSMTGVFSAEEAQKILNKTSFDLVFVDYKLPGNDGLWLIENVLNRDNLKFVLITGYSDKETIQKNYDFGGLGYLIKPFTVDDVARHINFNLK